MSKIYTIYHIPEFVYSDGSVGKIGVSYELTRRIRNNKLKSLEGFNDWEVLEEHTDIYEVSLREQQLQREYGYKVDSKPYYKTIKMATKQSRSKGGKIGGSKGGKVGGKAPSKSPLQREHMKRMVKLGAEAVKRPILQYDLDGNLLREWECGAYAARELGLQSTLINAVVRGKQKTTGGYTFKYKE